MFASNGSKLLGSGVVMEALHKATI